MRDIRPDGRDIFWRGGVVRELVKYESANKELSQITSIPELTIRIAAYNEAVKQAKAQKNPEAAFEASIKNIAGKARVGELLAALQKNPGPGRGQKRTDTVSDVLSEYTKALDEARLNERSAQRWQQIHWFNSEYSSELGAYFKECEEKKNLPRENYILSLVADKRKNQAEHKSGELTLANQDAVTFLADLDDQSIDLLLTDPPYSTDVPDIDSFSGWVDTAMKKIKPTGRAYIFIGAYPAEMKAYLDRLEPAPHGFTFDNILVWTYRNTIGPSPKQGYKLNWQACLYLYGPDAPSLDCPSMVEQFTVHDVNAPDARTGARYHAWQKPDELAERLIQHSTKEGGLVVDPFAGTGTFILAAQRLGRDALGNEIDMNMIATIDKRKGVSNAA